MSAYGWAAWLPALVAWALILILRRSRAAARLADHPNERSLHERPTPRLGGVGLVASALAFMAALDDPALRAVAACALALAVVSFADDVRSLPIQVRLPAHVAAAAVALLAFAAPAAGGLPWGWMESTAALFAIVWMTNLFNFMDGSDGLAGGMAVIGFATLAAAAHASGFGALAVCCAVVASASAGFLVHNFPPARVFLGDAGSVPLGFLAGALGALGARAGAWPAWFPLLVFSPFIVDATVTILRRLARGERIWIAHRSHYYQRLVLGGWSRRRLAFAFHGVMIAAAASAWMALRQGAPTQYAIISAWVVLYALLLAAIDRRFPTQVRLRGPTTPS